MNANRLTERLLQDGESSKVDFQSSPDALDEIGKAVCAFLNTKGGVVFVGVDDMGRPNATANQQHVDQLREFLHKAITPQVLFTISLDATAEGDVIAIDVPASLERPCVFGGAAFIRRGGATHLADAETLRELVRDSSWATERWERRPSTGLELEDLDLELLNETVRRAEERRGYSFDNPRDPASALSALAVMRFGQLTNAADVLFGKRVAIRHPQTRLRAVRYETDRADNFIDEQLYEGPAFRLLNDVLAFLKRHISIAAQFVPGQAERDVRPTFPFSSLEEGLVNALVHRDYASFSGGVSVSIYPDRVEIWNSGHLPKGLTAKMLQMAQHDSILINPDISHVFYLRGLMERVGRGTYQIVRECREFGMRTPEWKNVASGVRLTLFAATGSVSLELNERQIALLQHLEPGSQFVTPEFSEKFAPDVSPRQARRDLETLEDLGFLSRSGAGRGTTYTRTEKRLK